MIEIKKLTFNPFQENTYVLYDETKECVIIDPGCYTHDEHNKLKAFILGNGLKPVKLINTHCHIDHVLGNYFVAKTYGLELGIHKSDLPTLKSVPTYCHAVNSDGMIRGGYVVWNFILFWTTARMRSLHLWFFRSACD